MKIRKAVIPAAGLGTRVLPASKAIPKEMLPIVDKPVIQYIVEEAVAAGIEEILIITSRGKGAIEDHFDRSPELEERLLAGGKQAIYDEVTAIPGLANLTFIRQKETKGLGHAVLCAKEMVRDEPFAVMVGDDFMIGDDAGLTQLVQVASEHDMPVIGVMEVPADKVNRYGIVMGEEITPGVYNITDMVEKPAIGTVDSRLAIVGRYVLTPDIFEHLARVKPGHGGEIQLTDALASLARERGMLAVKMGGIRFDAGDWVDYLTANIYFGLRDEKLRDGLKARLRELLD